MNSVYIISFRRHLFWNIFSFSKKYKIIGHSFDKENDKMVLYFPDGSIQEIVRWKDCEINLSSDWVLAMKNKMEKEIGHNIPLNV